MPYDRYEFYTSIYDFELDRSEKLESRLTTPLGILALLGGLLGFLIREYHFAGWSIAQLTFTVFLVFAVLCYIGATYFLIRSYHSEQYRLAMLPSPSSFEELRPTVSQADFEEGVIQSLVEPADYNRRVNNKKSGFRHKSKTSLIATTIFVGLALIPFLFGNHHEIDKIYKVELVRDSVSLKSQEDSSMSKSTQNPPSAPKSANQPTASPAPVAPRPATVYISESTGKPVQPPAKPVNAGSK